MHLNIILKKFWQHEILFIHSSIPALFPELVTENKEGILAVNYSGLIPVMIESIKEQQKQIDELKKLMERILK